MIIFLDGWMALFLSKSAIIKNLGSVEKSSNHESGSILLTSGETRRIFNLPPYFFPGVGKAHANLIRRANRATDSNGMTLGV